MDHCVGSEIKLVMDIFYANLVCHMTKITKRNHKN